jgi:hypothetical protein
MSPPYIIFENSLYELVKLKRKNLGSTLKTSFILKNFNRASQEQNSINLKLDLG